MITMASLKHCRNTGTPSMNQNTPKALASTGNSMSPSLKRGIQLSIKLFESQLTSETSPTESPIRFINLEFREKENLDSL